MKKYLVGGAVRDEIMGVRSKDLDYSVVLTQDEKELIYQRDQSPFDFMANTLADEGYKIFLETPEHFTVRAQTPDKSEVADFVLAREEGPYSDGRRPDWVKPGTLLMDQQRRDFTVNAIAKDPETGAYIDPFDGIKDIEKRIIRAVGNPMERLTEDALRAIRAMRFGVTKGFGIQDDLREAMESDEVIDAIENKISDERIQGELNRMLAYNTVISLSYFQKYPRLTEAMFSGRVSLEATMKQRKG